MTKKKFISITVVCTLLFLLISGAVLFFAEYKINTNDHYNKYVDFKNSFMETLCYCDLQSSDLSFREYSLYNLDYLLDENADINCAYAIADLNGNLIAKSSPMIYFRTEDNFPDIRYINLEPYLTEKIYKKIRRYTGSKFLYVESVSVHKDGDELIPVEAEFGAGSKKNIKIKFTDNEPDCILTHEDDRLYAYNLGENRGRFYDSAYYEMEQNINKFISECKEESLYTLKSEPWWNVGQKIGYHYKVAHKIGTAYNEDGCQETVIFYLETNNNLTYDTITSEEFYKPVLVMTAIFLAAGFLICRVGLSLIKKNEMLNKSRNAFVSAAAHELKTPLAVIANNCECILENVSPDKNMEYVTTVYDETKRMSKMVKSLLEYNKLSTDAKFKKETIDFGEIINREVSSFMPLIESKQIAFSKEMPEKVSLKCDEKLMSMVISNFLSNAVKFTPENGEIKITVAESGGKLTFLIFNSGSEISKEDAPHIWDELYTGSESRSRDENSTGMGLAVSRVILEMHGFTYGFRNTNNGVAFYFDE